MRKNIAIVLLALLMVGLLANTVLAAPKVYVNGLQVKFDDVEPIIDNGRVLNGPGTLNQIWGGVQ